jgi:hypothetical protein
MRSSLKLLSLVDAGGVLAHVMTTSAFCRRTDALIARREHPSVAGASTSPVPAIIQSFVQRAIRDDRVPNTVCLSQRGEMRAGQSCRPVAAFIAEQVISTRQPGFVWRARVQAAPLVSARILDCYLDGEGLLELRLFGSWRLARPAGPQASTAELMRYLAELPWAPHAVLHNPRLSWREIDATTVEVSAETRASSARVRLIFENGDITCVEAEGGRTPSCSDALRRALLGLSPDGWLPNSHPGGGKLVAGLWPVRILAQQGNGIPHEMIMNLKQHGLT